jgi:hypothetical protein
MYFSHISFNDLIPFESKDPNERKNKKRIIIGHNVGYDRSYIREQYYLEVENYKFQYKYFVKLKKKISKEKRIEIFRYNEYAHSLFRTDK